MIDHSLYLDRCVDLARLANKQTKTNPMVGAVVVYKDSIIGEGYHAYFGGPHAEVNAINNVKPEYKHLIPDSTLYVSLEPCNIFGKTPPCTDLIMDLGIKKVVIGSLDPNTLMNGKSLVILKENGHCEIEVIDHQGCKNLIRQFVKNQKKEAYITLKWAKTSDHYIGIEGHRVKITENGTDIMMHKLRSEVDGILVGKNTALIDNPSLTTRHYPGDDAAKILIDDRLEVPITHRIFDNNSKTIILNQIKDEVMDHIIYLKYDKNDPHDLLSKLYAQNIYHCLIEGGAKILNFFIQNMLWDEAIIITNNQPLYNPDSLKSIGAPLLHGRLLKSITTRNDRIDYVLNKEI
jgi:diaminohydroxyphosphoribosylaminopyrimidine deaminase / 5-amino-6-(5-phosphoribosylamino)uracil reductase